MPLRNGVQDIINKLDAHLARSVLEVDTVEFDIGRAYPL